MKTIQILIIKVITSEKLMVTVFEDYYEVCSWKNNFILDLLYFSNIILLMLFTNFRVCTYSINLINSVDSLFTISDSVVRFTFIIRKPGNFSNLWRLVSTFTLYFKIYYSLWYFIYNSHVMFFCLLLNYIISSYCWTSRIERTG